MLQWVNTYAAKCMFQTFQLFQTYVVSVLSRCCICCCGYTHMLQAYVSNISPISDIFCSKCFILQVFPLVDEGSKRRQRRSHVRGQSPCPCAAAGVGTQQHGRTTACEQQHVSSRCSHAAACGAPASAQHAGVGAQQRAREQQREGGSSRRTRAACADTSSMRSSRAACGANIGVWTSGR
jgi:hypothetical protein